MPKYLVEARYNTEGAKGLLKEGGSKRRAAVEDFTKSLGGKVEAFYFAFGDADVYCVIDAPDNAGMAASSLIINSAGLVSLKTTVLLTPEEIDKAVQRSGNYRAPGT